MIASVPTIVELPRQIHDAITAHARFCVPNEACGLLAVDAESAIRFVYALTNRAGSPHRYVVDPTEHFRAIQHADANGWSIGGVFHSHPAGPAIPSAIDEAEALDPGWIHVIAAGKSVRAWSIDGATVELPLVVVD